MTLSRTSCAFRILTSKLMRSTTYAAVDKNFDQEGNKSDTPSPLTSLPIEIYLLVLDQLLPSDAACLALACKSFWLNLPSSRLPSSVDGKEWSDIEVSSFLLRLDFDCPSLIFCHNCLKLHSRQDSSIEYASAHLRGPHRPCQQMFQGSQTVCLCTHVVLGHETVALVLKADSHPDSAQPCGLPLSVLEHECTSRADEGLQPLTPVSLCIVPKIVNERVLLRLSYCAIIDKTEDLQSQIQLMNCMRCFHDVAVFKEQCLSILRQAFQESESGGKLFRWNEVGVCAYCASDARVRTMRRSIQQYVLEVQVWKDLGRKVDSPIGQPWSGHASFGRSRLNRDDYPLDTSNLREVFRGNDASLG